MSIFKLFLIFLLCCTVTAKADDYLTEQLDKYTEQAVQEVEPKPLNISRKQALLIAEQLDVVKALYDLDGGTLVNCLEKSVVRSCESQWVTCIDDAWVVEFVVGKQCPIVHDGRLNVTVVVNGQSGEIISQYPEVDYFKDNIFCRDKVDCMRMDVKNSQRQSGTQQCFNFVYAQSQISAQQNIIPPAENTEEINLRLKARSEGCQCQNHACTVEK